MPRCLRSPGIMSLARVLRLFSFAIFATASTVLASDPAVDTPNIPRVRITDERLRTLFEEGLQNSPTLRALVSRLERSDVVVYVQPDYYGLSGYAGGLTFLSATGGLRYVVARVDWLRAPAQQVAMIAHELQHAAEVADNPEIVDDASMFREYIRMGHVSGWLGSGVAVDTPEAGDVERRVAEELRGMSRSDLAGPTPTDEEEEPVDR